MDMKVMKVMKCKDRQLRAMEPGGREKTANADNKWKIYYYRFIYRHFALFGSS